MGKYGRCLSMPSTSSSWTTLLESLPGETWPLGLKAQPPEQSKEATLLGTWWERGPGAGSRETWGRTKRGGQRAHGLQGPGSPLSPPL